MPIDCLNDNVPVYDPDEKGCYRWMSVKAGQPSKFCSAVTLEGDPTILEVDGCINACFDPPIPPVEPRFRDLHPLAMSVDRSFTIVGSSNPYPCVRTDQDFTGADRSSFGEFLHYTIPEDNRFPDGPKAGMAFGYYHSQPVAGEVPGDTKCVPFATYGNAKMRDTNDVFPCINIVTAGHYRVSSHIRFLQFDRRSNTGGTRNPELLFTLSNYKNPPPPNTPIPADHLTLWRNVRLTEDPDVDSLAIADRQLNYEFDVSPALLLANGGVVSLAFMIAFRDDGNDPSEVTERDARSGSLGSFTVHGRDYRDQDSTLLTPLAPQTDFLWDSVGIEPYPGGRGIPLEEKNTERKNGSNFILQWVSKYEEPTFNGITSNPPQGFPSIPMDPIPAFPTSYA